METLVLREIMALNTEMSTMSIDTEEEVKNDVKPDVEPTNGEVVTTSTANENVKSSRRRSLRKRIHPSSNKSKTANGTKIQKLSGKSDVEKYYLNKTVKRLPPTLETIFEEPKEQNNTQLFLSSRRFKRVINFDPDVAAANKLKIKKRHLKAKKIKANKTFLNRKKVSIDMLLQKLTDIDSDKE